MKNKILTILQHPNQEDKSGSAMYTSFQKVNSSTNNTREDDVNMPRGAETDYKDKFPESKKKRVKGSLGKKPKQ